MSTFPTNAALEAAIIAHADEDTPRLVYADWLDENGDPDRAAFIRVQCRLADMSPDDPDWCALDVQLDELIRRLTERISDLRQKVASPPYYFGYFGGGQPSIALRRHFHRGFPSFLSDQGYASAADAPHAVDLAHLVENTTYRELHFNHISPARFAELVKTPHFAQLRGLSVTFEYGGGEAHEAARAAAYVKLVEAPVAGQLRRLDLDSCPGRALPPLSESAGFPALRRLSYSTWRADSAELRALVSAPWLRGLRQLALSAVSGDGGDVLLPGAGELPELYALELRIAGTKIDSLVAGRFPRLARLDVSDAQLQLRGFQKLLSAPWFAQLRALDVTNNGLGDRAAVALAAHPVAQSLRDLRIGNNALGKKGLRALAEPGAFPELVRLDLSLADIRKRKATESDLTAFLSGLACPRLRALDLKGLPLGDDGASAIAANLSLGELRELHLGTDVTERGMKALRSAAHLRQTRIV